MEGPGVATPRYKDLDKLADKFVDVRDQKAELASELGKIEAKIIEKMIEHGVEKYRYADKEVFVKPGKKHARVKTVKVDSDEQPPEEGLLPD